MLFPTKKQLKHQRNTHKPKKKPLAFGKKTYKFQLTICSKIFQSKPDQRIKKQKIRR